MRTIFALLLAAGCAGGAAGNRSVVLRPFSNPAAGPVRYSVGNEHVVGSDFDARVENNCVRGNFGRLPVDFCRKDDVQAPEQHWVGASGDFTVRPEGDQVGVNGYWNLDTGRTLSMNQTIKVGEGAGWAELKAHPALLAVASAAADMQAAHVPH